MKFCATTIIAVKHGDKLVVGGDGQVTFNNMIMKHSAAKVRTLDSGKVLVGFAGGAADAFALLDRFESKLKESGGVLSRAVVELAKEWRTDKYLRKLEALMVAGDARSLFLVSGLGDVLQPDDGIIGIGSGGNFALSSARALARHAGDRMTAREIAEASLRIASELCPFTNSNFSFEEIAVL